MSYYDALAAKWADLSGSTDEKLAAVNALTVAGPTAAVPVDTIIAYLWQIGAWLGIKAAAASGSSIGAQAAVDINDNARLRSIDFTLQIAQAMLADLVDKELLTQAQADAITAMGATTQPWWQANGYSSPIGKGDLEAAGLA